MTKYQINKLINKFFGLYLINHKPKSVYIIAVENAGFYVADILADCFKKNKIKVYCGSVKCQRPSTKQKKGSLVKSKLIKLVLTLFPYWFLDKLRILEHKKLLVRNKKITKRIINKYNIDRQLFKDADEIIVVDDAVDSGFSFKSVHDFLIKESNRKDMKFFVIVKTQNNPVICPDYIIF